MKVKIKKLHKDAIIPQYSKSGDAGMDLTAVSKSYDDDGNVCYGVGLAFEIPDGYVGLLFPRSSNAKKDLILSNSVGVLDSGYRGEVLFKFHLSNYYKPSMGVIKTLAMRGYLDSVYCDEINNDLIDNDLSFSSYNIGDRIGQIIILPYPKIEFEEVEELSDSERGSGGYGSTGS